MNYKETIEYLFSRLPMFSKIGGAAYKADLSNTIELCNALDNPQQKFKTIHIAGTNGKGSVSHMLAAILQTAGYKTGLYTSPHLKDFRERIKINGKMVSEEFVIDFTSRINPQIEKLEPSFFEITVAMAFDYFAQEKVDIAVIETGMGGRLDSTNIITPEVSVITNIGFDHMQFLGDTLEKIAFEKAGIIKQHTPVIIGEIQEETLPVFKKITEEMKASLIVATEDFEIKEKLWEYDQFHVTVEDKLINRTINYKLDLAGIYQSKNLLTVLSACKQLKEKKWKITNFHIQNALQDIKKLTGFFGRWQMIHSDPMIVLDVAHNVAGMNQVLQQIGITYYKNLHIIIGMAKDKDHDEILKMLPKSAIYYFTKAEIQRALPEKDLATKAFKYELHGDAYQNVNHALYSACRKAEKGDLIIVCGSIFLIGEVSMKSIQESLGKETVLMKAFEVLQYTSFFE